MATKLYFTNSAPEFSPTAQGLWQVIGGSNSFALSFSPAGASATQLGSITSAASGSILLAKFVGPAWTGEQFVGASDTCDAFIGENVNNTTGTNGALALVIWISVGNTSTVRGFILGSGGSPEHFGILNTTGQGITTTNTPLQNPAASPQIGDHLVVEVGWQKNGATSATRTGTMWYGNTGTTDLGNGDTNVTTHPATISFSKDLLLTPQRNLIGVGV